MVWGFSFPGTVQGMHIMERLMPQRHTIKRISIILLLTLVLQLLAGLPASASGLPASASGLPASASGLPVTDPFPLGGNSLDTRLHAIETGLGWLAALQNADGGFGIDAASDWLSTALAVQTFLARGYDASSLEVAGVGANDYLTAGVAQIGSDAYQIAQMILAGVALGEDPADFAGRNWPVWLDGTYQADGRYASASAGAVDAQVMAIAALGAAYETVPPQALEWLKSAVQADGGWGETPAGPSDAYHTGLALWSLGLAGESTASAVVKNAVGYLVGQQRVDGGFGEPGATSSDPLSTGAATLGLLAAGESLLDAMWLVDGWSVFDALLAMQSSNGAFVLPDSGEPDVAATLWGVTALVGRTDPARHPTVAAERAIEWLHTQQCLNDPTCDETILGPGSLGPASTTSDAIVAIAAVGQDPDGDAWTLGWAKRGGGYGSAGAIIRRSFR